MDQLKGKVVNVVLTIQEGKGMEAMRHLAFISANFNGRVLESDPVSSEDCPIFNTNLIWEVEKKDLRRIRSANQPLRVECFSCDAQNRREKFGHVLLDLRSAQVVDEDGCQVLFRWHKLIGVRNKRRNCSPELFLALTIRNHLEVEPEETTEDIWEVEPRREGSISVKYLEDGYIAVGEECCVEDYSLDIHIKSAINLDLLLPEVLVFHHNSNKYHMCIKIFGIPIKTKQFSKNLQEKISFEEKIVVRLLSNFDTLKRFFAEEKFEVGFVCGSDLLGVTNVSFEGLDQTNDRLLLSECLFRFPSPNGIIPMGDNERRPSVSLEILLVRNRENNCPPQMLAREISKASGDHGVVSQQERLPLVTEEQVREFEEWKEKRQAEFEEELQRRREEEFGKEREEIEVKQAELDENVKRCKQLQEELQEKLDELKLSRSLKKMRKSSDEILEENRNKFADCEKELLIDYISSLQSDNENLKQMISELKQEIANMQKTALTKEQTTNLLQELRVLEEKFHAAQQTKSYFKEQWMKACQEIHNLKTEDYKQLQDQLRERREELSELDHFYSVSTDDLIAL